MKTSNKLLIILLTLVFSIPLAMIMSFKSAVRNNQYVLKNSSGYDEMPEKRLNPFKVVLLEGSGDQLLKCHIKNGTGFSYRINNYIENKHYDTSKMIRFQGDTLVIRHRPKIDQSVDNNYIVEADLDLYLHQGVSVVARGAAVTVNTNNGGYVKPLEFDLSEDAELKITTDVNRNHFINDSISERHRFLIPFYSIKSNNSRVDIDAHIRVQKLNVVTGNNSTLTIGKHVMIDSLNASIAPETMVEAPYKLIGSIKR